MAEPDMYPDVRELKSAADEYKTAIEPLGRGNSTVYAAEKDGT
jgi:hypothetical protein